ncbi:MAG: RNA 2',3'-cyclic phosphodiesterase [Symbiobacteriaceae bacterium]|nr:RNA 2',3'-cyclic phosphodiesterase [Symbiobacteriaceae bacterium]
MRLFYALNFSPRTCSRLISLRDELKIASYQGSFTLDDNLHLTLVFLGECDQRKTATAINLLAELDCAAQTICFDRVGCFRRADGDIWWAGVRESKALNELYREMVKQLSQTGFQVESRRYMPHITLGREIICAIQPHAIDPFYEQVTSLELMKSERRQGVLTYTPIHSKPFSLDSNLDCI